MGMKTCVALYIEYNNQGVICEFEKNGDISIRIQFADLIAEEKLDEFIYNSTEQYINTVMNYLSKSGYMMEGFTSIYSPNVEINKINYSVVYPLKQNINVKNIQSCLSSMFAISASKKVVPAYTVSSKNVVTMRMKRVANFDEMESQDAYIMDMLQQRVTKDMINLS